MSDKARKAAQQAYKAYKQSEKKRKKRKAVGTNYESVRKKADSTPKTPKKSESSSDRESSPRSSSGRSSGSFGSSTRSGRSNESQKQTGTSQHRSGQTRSTSERKSGQTSWQDYARKTLSTASKPVTSAASSSWSKTKEKSNASAKTAWNKAYEKRDGKWQSKTNAVGGYAQTHELKWDDDRREKKKAEKQRKRATGATYSFRGEMRPEKTKTDEDRKKEALKAQKVGKTIGDVTKKAATRTSDIHFAATTAYKDVENAKRSTKKFRDQGYDIADDMYAVQGKAEKGKEAPVYLIPKKNYTQESLTKEYLTNIDKQRKKEEAKQKRLDKTKVDEATEKRRGTLKAEDLTMEDYLKVQNAQRMGGGKIGNKALGKDLAEKVGSMTAYSAGKNNLAKFSTGVLQGAALGDVIHGGVGTYNKNAKGVLRDVTESGQYLGGYMAGIGANFIAGGAAKSGEAMLELMGKQAAKTTAGKIGRKAAANMAVESPLNVADAIKMSRDENGKVDKKTLAMFLALNTGLSGAFSGGMDAIGTSLTKSKGKKLLGIQAKIENGTASLSERQEFSKILEELGTKSKEAYNPSSVSAKDAYETAQSAVQMSRLQRRMKAHGASDETIAKAMTSGEVKKMVKLNAEKLTRGLSEEETKQLAELTAKENVQRYHYGKDMDAIVEKAKGKNGKLTSEDAFGLFSAVRHYDSVGDKAKAKEARTILKQAEKAADDRNMSMAKAVNTMSERTGIEYKYVSADEMRELTGKDVDDNFFVNGVKHTDENGKSQILINRNSPQAHQTVIGHETGHLIKSNSEKEFRELGEMLRKYATDKGEFKEFEAEMKRNYPELDKGDLDEEITCELLGRYIFGEDDKFLSRLAGEQPSVFRRIIDYIRNFAKNVDNPELASKLNKIQDRAEKAIRGIQPIESADVRYSKARKLKQPGSSDSDYIKAIESDDFQSAQKYVDQAARENGYTIKAYRGGTRNTYDREHGYYTGTFFSSSKDIAGGFSSKDVGGYYLRMKKPLVLDAEGRSYVDIPVRDTHPDKELVEYAQDSFDYISGESEYGTVTADDIGKWADEHGYDGVVIDNVKEGVGGEPQTDYIAIGSEQIKSADAVTYDESGRIIPLSERFDDTKPDVRYSKSRQPAEAGSFYGDYPEGAIDEIRRFNEENASSIREARHADPAIDRVVESAKTRQKKAQNDRINARVGQYAQDVAERNRQYRAERAQREYDEALEARNADLIESGGTRFTDGTREGVDTSKLPEGVRVNKNTVKSVHKSIRDIITRDTEGYKVRLDDDAIKEATDDFDRISNMVAHGDIESARAEAKRFVENHVSISEYESTPNWSARRKLEELQSYLRSTKIAVEGTGKKSSEHPKHRLLMREVYEATGEYSPSILRLVSKDTKSTRGSIVQGIDTVYDEIFPEMQQLGFEFKDGVEDRLKQFARISKMRVRDTDAWFRRDPEWIEDDKIMFAEDVLALAEKNVASMKGLPKMAGIEEAVESLPDDVISKKTPRLKTEEPVDGVESVGSILGRAQDKIGGTWEPKGRAAEEAEKRFDAELDRINASNEDVARQRRTEEENRKISEYVERLKQETDERERQKIKDMLASFTKKIDDEATMRGEDIEPAKPKSTEELSALAEKDQRRIENRIRRQQGRLERMKEALGEDSSRVKQIEEQIKDDEKQLEKLRRKNAKPGEAKGGFKSLDDMGTQDIEKDIRGEEIHLERAKEKYGEDSPRVKEIEDHIEDARSRLDKLNSEDAEKPKEKKEYAALSDEEMAESDPGWSIEKDYRPEGTKTPKDAPVSAKPDPEERKKAAAMRPPKSKLMRNIQSKGSSFVRKWVSSLAEFEKTAQKTGSKRLQQAANNVYQARNRASAWIERERTAYDRSITGDGLNTIYETAGLFGPKNAAKRADFTNYLTYKHAIDRLKVGKPVHMAEDGSSLYTEAQYREFMKTIRDNLSEAEVKQLDEFEKGIRKYQDDLMRYMVDTGLVSEELAAQLKERYPHYVPTFRKGDELMDIIGGSPGKSARIDSQIKTATGGKAELQDLYQQLAERTHSVIQNGEQNVLMNEYCKAMGIKPEQIAKDVELDDVMDTAISASHDDVYGYRVHFFSPEGQPVTLAANKQIVKGLREFNAQDVPMLLNACAKLSGPMKAFKGLITDYNLIFGVRNGSRDAQQAIVNSKDSMWYSSSIPTALRSIADKNSVMRRYYEANGGFHSGLVYQGKELVEPGSKTGVSGVVDKTIGAALRRIEDANGAIEMAPRMCEFIGTLKKNADKVLKEQGRKDGLKDLRKEIQQELYPNKATLNPKEINKVDEELMQRVVDLADRDVMDEAARNAADITLNFGRNGMYGKYLNLGIVPYLNPSIQGISKTKRLFTEGKAEGTLLSFMMKLSVLTVTPAVMNEVLCADNEAYQRLNTRDKDSNFFIYIGEDQFIKIPKPRENAVLAEPAEYATRYLLDNAQIGVIKPGEYSTKKDFKQMFKSGVDNIGPINPLEENLFSPLVRLWQNKTWYGGSIESTSEVLGKKDGTMKNSDIADERSSSWAKAIGQKTVNGKAISDITHLSPKKIDNLMDSYLGVIYDVGISQTADSAHGNPILHQFVTDSVFSNKNGTELWMEFDKLNSPKTLGGKAKKFAKDKVLGHNEYNISGKSPEAQEWLNQKGYDDITYSDALHKLVYDKDISDIKRQNLQRRIKKYQNEFRKELVYGKKEVTPELDPIRGLSKVFGVEKAMKDYTYTYEDPKTGKKFNAHLDAFKHYMKSDEYKKDKAKSQEKWLDYYTDMRYTNSKIGEKKYNPQWMTASILAADKKGNNDALAKAYIRPDGDNPEEFQAAIVQRGKNYIESGSTKKQYIKAQRDIYKGSEKLGYEKPYEMKKYDSAMTLADKKHLDGAYYSADVDGKVDRRMNPARCLAANGHDTKEIHDFAKKYHLDQDTKGWGREEWQAYDKQVEAAVKKEYADQPREIQAAAYHVITGDTYNHPFGEIGDYSLDGDTGVTDLDKKDYSGYGHGRRRRWHRRYRRHGRGGGGGGSGSGSGGTGKDWYTFAGEIFDMKEPAKTAARSTRSSVPKASDFGHASRLDDAYRRRVRKQMKKS